VASTTYDTYAGLITPQPGPNMPQGAMWGNRIDSFSTFHFEVLSQASRAQRPDDAHAGHVRDRAYDLPPPLPGGPTTALVAP
jgi:hypothetical protein